MTKKQYAEYEKNVANFLVQNHVKPGCFSPVNTEAEPFFSWHSCDCCDSPLGGNRETYNFAVEEGQGIKTFSADICTDCIYYLTYGQLDDSTMMDIEQSPE